MLISFLSDSVRPQAEEIFKGLKNQEFHKLIQAGVTHKYKKGEIVFREGGIPSGIYYLSKGHIKKYKFTSSGGEQIFYICGAGELLGYHSVLGGGVYADSAATISDSEITFIPKEAFLNTLASSPEFTLRFMKALGNEFTLFKNAIATRATYSVKERLAINLLILDEKFKKSKRSANGALIILSRTDLANIVGTVKENLVRVLGEFKAKGLIKINNGSIQIINRGGLIKRASL